MENITEAKFNTYEKIRESGITNMFDIKRVASHTGLSKDDVITIMENYSELLKKFK